MGTNNGVAIWLPEAERWRVVRKRDGLAGYAVWKFAPGPDGRVWSISRRTGLNRFDPDTLEPEAVPLPPECGTSPQDLVAGPDGTLWLGSKDALVAIRERDGALEFDPVTVPEELRGATVSVSVTGDGAVWVAGVGGLGRYLAGRWRAFGERDGLLSERLLDVAGVSADEALVVYEAARGVARLTTDDGATRVEHVTREDGLPGNAVWLIARDHAGRTWIGGSDGLGLIDAAGGIRTYDQGDGLIWNDIGQDALWVEKDGSAFIGTSRGLAYFDPARGRREERPPNVALTSAALGGVERLHDEDPRVDYDAGTFTARFAGLTFRKPRQVVFEIGRAHV